MTLPQPDKPVITDLVSDIVSNIKENQDYIEANYNKQAYAYGSLNITSAAQGATDASITGVGFQPSAVIIFSACVASGDLSWGFCDPILNNSCSIESTAAGVGSFGTTACLYHVQSPSGILQGKITSMGSDGFTIQYQKAGSPTGTLAWVALCLR